MKQIMKNYVTEFFSHNVFQRVLLVIFFGLSVVLVGCESDTEVMPQGLGQSVFQSTSYPVTAVLVDNGQKPVYLESLSIHACPSAKVRKQFKMAEQSYQIDLRNLEVRINEIKEKIDGQKKVKAESEERITEEYNQRRPIESAASSKIARNPLKALSKARAEKDNTDVWAEQQRLEQTEPTKAIINSLEDDRRRLNTEIEHLRASLNNRLFNSLPTPTKSWKTGKDGRVGVDLPNNAPWTVWSIVSYAPRPGMERMVRWILEVPTDLDSSRSIHLDLTTAFDVRGVTINNDADDEGDYIRRHKRR